MTVFEVAAKLKAAKIHHTFASVRDGAILIDVAVPGERWEIEVFEDGHLEVERFLSQGEIEGDAALIDLLARFSDE